MVKKNEASMARETIVYLFNCKDDDEVSLIVYVTAMSALLGLIGSGTYVRFRHSKM